MAINYNNFIKNKKAEDMAPLTEEELGFVTEVEEFIDDEIKKKINTDNKEVWIFLGYAKFQTRLGKKTYPPMTNARKELLMNTLISRYETAGWGHRYHIDDGYDGNMSGSDYLILKGKEQ